jgi:hypothetical protein
VSIGTKQEEEEEEEKRATSRLLPPHIYIFVPTNCGSLLWGFHIDVFKAFIKYISSHTHIHHHHYHRDRQPPPALLIGRSHFFPDPKIPTCGHLGNNNKKRNIPHTHTERERWSALLRPPSSDPQSNKAPAMDTTAPPHALRAPLGQDA